MTPEIVGGADLTAQQVHDIWQIRDAVFAYEQHVDDVDVDGRDLLATTTHLWFADAAGLTSYLRVYAGDDGGPRVGRVCTRIDQRGRGLSGGLMTAVHDRWGHQEIRLGAQAYLERWYEGFDYRRTGDNYDDAGIDHVPMARPGRTDAVTR